MNIRGTLTALFILCILSPGHSSGTSFRSDLVWDEIACPLDAGADTTVCGFQYLLQGSERTGSWSLICSESRDVVYFANQFTDTTFVTVPRCGSYTFVYDVPDGPCAGTDTIVVTFLDPSVGIIYNRTDVEVEWDVECHSGPAEVICDNTVTIDGQIPPELIWEICREDSCYSRIFSGLPGLPIDSCIVDTIGFDTTITSDSGQGCGDFILENADDYIEALNSLGTNLGCPMPFDSCHPCFDTITVVDTLVVPILMGGLWHYVSPTQVEIPLMDSSFLQINGRDYLLIIEPGSDYYGPEDIQVTLWEIIGGIISELTVPVTIDLQWVPEIENDTLFRERDSVFVDSACAADLKLVPCGGILIFRDGSFSGIPDFPCGPISISFDVDDGDQFITAFLNCANPIATLEVCPDEYVDFDSPEFYEFECNDGCPSITIVEVYANFTQPLIANVVTVCASDQQTYEVTFTVVGGDGPIEVLGVGSFSYDQPITITGIASCEDFIISVFDPFSECESIDIVSHCCCQDVQVNWDEQICEGEVYDFFGQQLTQPGGYQQLFTTPGGCDSLINLDLMVLPSQSDLREATICEGESYNFYGQQLTVTGMYDAMPVDPNGCDSMVTLDLTVDPLQADARVVVICEGESFNFYGDILTQPGSYQVEFSNPIGCDSLVDLDLSVASPVSITLNEKVCAGESYDFNGSLLYDSGTYNDTLVGLNGCDSAITLYLTVADPVFEVATDHSCFEQANGSMSIFNVAGGEAPYEYSIDGSNYQSRPDFNDLEPGEYTVYVVDAWGCSALRQVDIYEIPAIETDVEDTYLICGGDPVVIDVQQPIVDGDTVMYQWSTGSDSSAFVVTTIGDYWVEIRNACEVSVYEFIVQSEDESPASRIYVPNVFSPNEDGINDHFKAFASVPLQYFEMHIYDRWGEEVLIMRDIEEFWDGGFLGKNMQPGVYVWWLKAELENCAGEMQEVLMKGDVTLVR